MSIPPRAKPLRPGGSLPHLSLPSAPDGAPRPLRARGRRNPVVVLVHGAGCEQCRAYLERLAAERGELDDWDAAVVAVLPEGVEAARALAERGRLPFPVLADPEARTAAACGLQPPALLVADQWGEIFYVEAAGPEHRFLDPAEIVQWVRTLAIQCGVARAPLDDEDED